MLNGTLIAIELYDVAEAISLERLRGRISERVRPSAVPAASFYRPPLVERLAPIAFASGNEFEVEIKFYDFGNISVSFSRPFRGEWGELVETASRWIESTEFDRISQELVRQRVEEHAEAIDKLFSHWTGEDYFIFRVDPVEGDVLREHGAEIAQIVRGENQPLSLAERNEVLQSAISYYPKDLAVIGWNGAFLMDTEAGAAVSLQLLEYANSQLLEFRHYDSLLSVELDRVYRLLTGRVRLVDRWNMARNASRMQGVLLEVTELTERAENAIKFLSDMYSARFYRLASMRIGVPDYRRLVGAKLQTAQDRYEYMLDQFNQTRALFLELTVIVILVIELASVLLHRR